MKKSELEKLVKEQGEKIEKLGIIPKAREIAEKLGECRYTSEKWATANYMYVDELLRIDYQVYAMGDREIKIDCIEEHIWCKVFHAKEGVSQQRPAYPLYVRDDRSSYEILEYKPNDWVRKLDILHSSIGKTLCERKRKEEREEEDEKDPEVSEGELEELQKRLGIKRK